MKNKLTCDLPCANRIARWAYQQTEKVGALTWLRGDELMTLSPEWRTHIGLPV